MGGDVPMVLKRKNLDSRLKISGMTGKGGRHPWAPLSSRCLSFLNVFIAPYSSPRRLPSRGPQYLKAYGCLIKDFRHDKKEGSFLNVSTRGLNYLKTRIFGFPIKDFGNDEKRRSSPLNGSTRGLNYLRAKNMDSHLSSPRQSSSRF